MNGFFQTSLVWRNSLKSLWQGMGTGVWALAVAPAWGAPGDVLPPAALTIESPGRVSHAHVTADQRVVIAGEFRSVNGTSVANFARLREDGSVDPAFQPALGFGNVATSSYGGTDERALQLFPLADGRLWVGLASPYAGSPSRRWTVLGHDGSERPQDFPDLPKVAGFVPQCESEGWLVLRQNTEGNFYESVVRRVSVSTGEGDAAFVPRIAGEFPPQFVRPAGGGKLWIGGRAATPSAGWGSISDATPTRSLYRLNEDGSKDTFFATKNFGQGELLNIFPRPGEDVLAVFLDTRYVNLWPRLTSLPVYFERLGPEGEVLDSNQTLWGPHNTTAPVRDAARRVLLLSTRDRPTWRRYSQEGVLDASFAEVEAGSAWPHLLTEAAEGRLLIDGTRRLLADGTPDPAWTAPDVRRRGGISELAVAPDGRVYAAGEFRFVNNQPQRGLVRFRADGTLDESFTPDPALSPALTQPVPLADGRLYVIETVYNIATGREEPRVVRLLANGALDPSFAPFSKLMGFGAGTLVRFAVFSDLSLLVTTRSSGGDFVSFYGLRVRADGTEEPDFPRHFRGGGHLSKACLTLPDGRFWVGATRFLTNGTAELTLPQERNEYTYPLVRLPDGRILLHRSVSSSGQSSLQATTVAGDAWDPSFVNQSSQSSDPPAVQVMSDGTFYVHRSPSSRVRRFYPDGRQDPVLSMPPLTKHSLPLGEAGAVLDSGGIVATATPWQGYIQSMQVSGEALWIAGDFNGIGGQRHDGLARLETGTPVGYAAWIAAVLRDPAHPAESRAEEADPDRDGAPNFLEYATGSDPLTADAGLIQPQILTTAPLTVAFYRNPGAPDLALVPEVSENGTDWRAATAAEAGVQSSTGLRTIYQIASGAPIRFVRGRFTRAAP